MIILHQFFDQQDGLHNRSKRLAQALALVAQALVCLALGEIEPLLRNSLGALGQFPNLQLLSNLEVFFPQLAVIGSQLRVGYGAAHLLAKKTEQQVGTDDSAGAMK